jgi:hypothetical protein
MDRRSMLATLSSILGAPALRTAGGDAGILQRQIDDAVSKNRGRRVELPASVQDFEFTRPVRLPPHSRGLRLVGQGRHWTTLHADFPASAAPEDRCFFRLENHRDFHGGGFAAEGRASAVAVHRSLIVRSDNSLMTNPTWEDVEIRGWTGIEDGFVHTARTLGGAESNDQNDEHANYINVSAIGLKGSAFVLAHSQCKEVRIERCTWMECGRYGVDATGAGYWGITARETAPRHRGASFSAVACRGGYSGIAEYGLGRPNGPVLLDCPAAEGARRLLDQATPDAGPSTVGQQVMIRGARVAFNKLAPDGYGIVLRNGGPLLIQGGGMGEGAPRPFRIFHAGLGGLSTIVEGVNFTTAGADRVFPVVQERVGRDQKTAPRYLRLRGNLYRAPGEAGDWPVAKFEVEELVEGVR